MRIKFCYGILFLFIAAAGGVAADSSVRITSNGVIVSDETYSAGIYNSQLSVSPKYNLSYPPPPWSMGFHVQTIGPLEQSAGVTEVTVGGSTGGSLPGTNGYIIISGADKTAQSVGISVDAASQDLQSNGFVKAWAIINEDGSVFRCFQCDLSADKTYRILAGKYQVSFGLLGENVVSRPRSATLSAHGGGSVNPGIIVLADSSGDSSSVIVTTYNMSGQLSDRPFVVMVY